MPIDSLDDVRLFRQIVSSGGISAAARVSHQTKNRVSQRLAALERALGVRLAQRTTRRLRLTEEGERFYAETEALLEAADRSERAVASAKELEGRVRLAVRSALAGVGIGADVVGLLRVAPRVNLQVVVVDDAADLLARGFDLAVQVGALPDSSLVARRIGSVRWVMAATPSYLDARGRPRTPADLVHHECIRKLDDEPETTWSLLDGSGSRVRAKVAGNFECSDERLQRDVLYAGLGIGVRPAEEVRRAAQLGTIERVLPTWTLAPTPAWVVGPKGRLALPRVALVVDLLERILQRLA